MVDNNTKSAARPAAVNRKYDSVLTVLALLTILLAGWIGLRRQSKGQPEYLQQLLPQATRFEETSDQRYKAYQGFELIGYATLGRSIGYGGPVQVAVAVDPQGKILNVVVVAEHETREYFDLVQMAGFMDRLVGKSYSDELMVGKDIDGVTSAPLTSRAIANATRLAARQIAENEFGEAVAEEQNPQIQFGLPEISLLALYGIGFVGHRKNFKYTRQARWISMLLGLGILGFLLNMPLSIAVINKFLLGYWPQWQTNLYWYMLLGGVLIVILLDSKNPYCDWFCPFGAAQECLGALGKAKNHTPTRYRTLLTWAPRFLAWLAVILALIYRNPAISSYEVFGTLFAFVGSGFQFVLLSLVLIASLFIRRPWCRYLCPVRPVTELLRQIRQWVMQLWKTVTRKNQTNGIS